MSSPTGTHEVAIPLVRPDAELTVIDLHLTLSAPTRRIVVRAPGATLGRADAVLGRQTWAAKHHFTEERDGEQLHVFEFDEPLPAGPVLLRIPSTPIAEAGAARL